MKRDIFKIKKSALGPRIAHPNGKVYKVRPKDIEKLLTRAKAIKKQLSEVKPLYSELDEITLALLTVKEELEKRRYGVAIVDKFSQKNVQFKNVAMTRYSLEWKA